MSKKNLYRPYPARIEKKTEETPDTFTFKLVFEDDDVKNNFSFKAGQFAEYSVFGEGECTFCIASSPTREGFVECTFKKAGRVTNALSCLQEGDVIGFRGPYGNTFPVEKWEGKNILFVAGGIGLAPVRCVIWNVLDQRDKFGDVTIAYGARNEEDLVYKHELKEWEERDDVKLITTIDTSDNSPNWKGNVGFVPDILSMEKPSSDNAICVICGPPVMIKITLIVLQEMGFTPDSIYTTLENKMKCGFGKCGRCNIGKVFVCQDGPVFSMEEINKLPPEF